MASDLSSGCTEVIEILDEKEEGEISLEDVSSSEEGQLNYGTRAAGQCSSCLSTKHCASWCTAPSKSNPKNSPKKDAVQEKENFHHTKDSGNPGSKHAVSTLQEKNNDLVPISSDSDMEIVGLADHTKQIILPPLAKTTKVRKKRRKKRTQNAGVGAENSAALSTTNQLNPECSTIQKRNMVILKDNALPRCQPRELNSPHRKPRASMGRSKVPKSPQRRHRSPPGRSRSPFRKLGSPLCHPRSPVLRKSPARRPRSPPRRSPFRSPMKSPIKNSFPPTSTYIDMYGNVNKLLKKVRQSQSGSTDVTKDKEHVSSLKDKLSNMMKGDDANDNVSCHTKPMSNHEKIIEDVDDEDDLALLRKMALDTKQKRPDASQKMSQIQTETKGVNINNDDEDIEDLELRMIALRSAMLKKHQDRMQRGLTLGRSKKSSAVPRNESPFSQSFLDSIPFPGEVCENPATSPPTVTTQLLNENTNPEDMELDSEVELEKEKDTQPYSPTDEISRQITIETELLGIHQSDVSFITPNSPISVVSNVHDFHIPENSKQKTAFHDGPSYFPNNNITDRNTPDIPYYSSAKTLSDLQSNASILYSPSDPTETPRNDFFRPRDQLPDMLYFPSQPTETPANQLKQETVDFLAAPGIEGSYRNVNVHQTPETPYSPTDTPIYDLDMPRVSPVMGVSTSNKLSKSSRLKGKRLHRKSKNKSCLIAINPGHISSKEHNCLTTSGILEPSNRTSPANVSFAVSELPLSVYSNLLRIEKDGRSDTSSMRPNIGSAVSSRHSSASSDSSMITIDDLPETDLDGSPLVPVPKELSNLEIHIPEEVSHEITKIAQEPLYLQGVPDVTKDVNKIPTLVNRSLVPAPILKSNKQLQQPLPPKKQEAHLEPVFKSAEMQPVQIVTEPPKSGTLFKPIKLAPVTKKPCLKMIPPDVFNSSLNGNRISEGHKANEIVKPVEDVSAVNIAMKEIQNEQSIKVISTLRAVSTEKLRPTQEVWNVQAIKTVSIEPEKQKVKNAQDIAMKSVETHKERSNDSQTVLERSDKEKKKHSRRSKSTRNKGKDTNKTPKKSKTIKSTGNKDAKPSKGIKDAMGEDNAEVDIFSLYQQALNSKKSNKTIKPDENIQKQKDEEVKQLKVDEERKRKEREKRNRIKSVFDDAKKWAESHGHEKRISKRVEGQALGKSKAEIESTDDKVRDQDERVKSVAKDTKIQTQNHVSGTTLKYATEMKESNDKSPQKPSQCGKTISEPMARDLAKFPGTWTKIPIATNNANTAESSQYKNNLIDDQEIDKSIENHVEPNINKTIHPICNEKFNRTENTITENTMDKKAVADRRRRSSLEEDEEALRAILLASLAKRSKRSIAAVSSSGITKSILSNLSDSVANSSTESLKNLPSTKDSKVTVESVFTSSGEATPPSPGQPLSISKISPSTEPYVPNPKIPNTVITGKFSPSNADSPLPFPSSIRKRTTSTSAKGPPKKMTKKAPISASTRAVNNAKKYQNTMVQKKLNLQKVAMISSAQKTLSDTNLRNSKLMEGNRPGTPVTLPIPDTQRFVINLGSDSESDIEPEPRNATVARASGTNCMEQPLAIPTTDFERSVDLFLKDVRKKHETEAAATKPGLIGTKSKPPVAATSNVNKKSPVLSATPLAVRHLPASQQEEYRRLKQQILEHERLKRQRALENSTSPGSPNSKSTGTPPGPLSPASPMNSPSATKQNQDIVSPQSMIAVTVKDSGPRSVSVTTKSSLRVGPENVITIQGNVAKSVNSSILPKVSTSITKATGAAAKPIPNLSVQIPTENSVDNDNSVPSKSSNMNVPVIKIQAAKLSSTSTTSEDSLKNRGNASSTTSTKSQVNLTNVQIQLKQGQTGRTVSVGEIQRLPKRISVTLDKQVDTTSHYSAASNNDVHTVDKNATTSILEKSVLGKLVNHVDKSVDISKMVDSEASTLILSRDDRTVDTKLVDSCASTVILSENNSVSSSESDLRGVQSDSSSSPSVKCSMVGEVKPGNGKEIWDKVRGDVKKELDALAALPVVEQRHFLFGTEQKLVTKRYMVLDDLTEMSGNLRQLELERDLQSSMVAEVKKLREQLKVAEESLQEQRSRVNSMVPNVTAAHDKINSGRRECVKLTRICLGLGSRVVGEHYKVPAAGAQLLNNRLKQVAGSTRQLSKKKVPSAGNSRGISLNAGCISVAGSPNSSAKSSSISGTSSTTYSEKCTQQYIRSASAIQIPELCGTSENIVATERDALKHTNCESMRTRRTEDDSSVEYGCTVTLTDQVETAAAIIDQDTVTAGTPEQGKRVTNDGPLRTSTPITSEESCNLSRCTESYEPGITTRSHCPKAGPCGQRMLNNLDSKTMFQPYNSVLLHLTSPRWVEHRNRCMVLRFGPAGAQCEE